METKVEAAAGGIRRVVIEMEDGRPVVNLTLQPYGKHAQPVRRRIELDVRFCRRCRKHGREKLITRTQAEATRKEVGFELCRRCLVDARNWKRQQQSGEKVAVPSADRVGDYAARINLSLTVTEVDAVLLEMAADKNATEQVIGAVKGIALTRKLELTPAA